MPTKVRDEDQRSEGGVRIVSSSTVCSQPWWHRVKDGVISSFGEANGVMKVGAQLEAAGDGVADDIDSSTGFNGSNDQDQHQVKQVETNSPMELVGHSIAWTSYPYQDPHYAGMMSYETSLAHPQYLGIHQTRMPLPLQMEEEPVYVNAKQYHGILGEGNQELKQNWKRK